MHIVSQQPYTGEKLSRYVHVSLKGETSRNVNYKWKTFITHNIY